MTEQQKQRLWNKFNFWKATHPTEEYHFCNYCRLKNNIEECLVLQGVFGEYRDSDGHYSCLGFLKKKNYIKG